MRALLLAGADRTREILLEDLPAQTLALVQAGGDATVQSARARGSLFRTETVDQKIPPDPADLVVPPDPQLEQPTAAQDVIVKDFFATNPQAINWAAAHSASEVVKIDAETRRAIQQIVSDAFEEGLTPTDPIVGPIRRIRGIPPRAMARRVRPLVGLTRRQIDAIGSLRAQMAGRVRGTFVRGDIKLKVPAGGFTQSQIDRAASRYAERLHRGRALNIARTETIDSANEGQRQTWLQAREDGLLTGAEKREWIVTPDDRLCPICRRMAGQLRGLEASFDAGRFGKVMGPTAHPQCRCATGLVSAAAAEDAGTGPTPTLPSGAPVIPPGVIPGGRAPTGVPLPARMTWDQIGGAARPRDIANRELAENGLNRALDAMPPHLRARAIETLREIPGIDFRAATASTKKLGASGRMTVIGLEGQAPQLKTMMLQLSRPNEAVRAWARRYADESKRLISLQQQGTITEAERIKRLTEYRKTTPIPDQWRLATEDEFAGTLVHELTHAWDFQAGTDIQFNPSGLTKVWRQDNMQEHVWRAFYRGEMDIVEKGVARLVQPRPGAIPDQMFAYATTKADEGLAETVRLYFHGQQGIDGATTMTAAEFRQRYPELAAWVERNIIGASGGG